MNRLTWISPIVFVVIMLGGVGVAQLSGAWITSGKQVVAAGQLAVDDVKGSMTLQVAADGLGVTVDDLITLINPSDRSLLTPATAFKDIEALVPGFELSAFRDRLRAFLAGSASHLPTPSASATTAAPVAPPTSSSAVVTPPPTAAGTGTATGTGDAQVKGSVTLRQVAGTYGLSLETLVAECGLPADVDVDKTLRDLSAEIPGFDVEAVRDAVGRLR